MIQAISRGSECRRSHYRLANSLEAAQDERESTVGCKGEESDEEEEGLEEGEVGKVYKPGDPTDQSASK